jgi:hypothetical protein
LLGRGGGSSHVDEAHSHQSAPLSTLKDPSTFAPPPKRLDYGASPIASRPATTAPGGSHSQERSQGKRRAEEEADRPPPGPYRPDTTGLSTAHLPKPPAFRPNAASPPPPPPSRNTATKSKPSLPPRLPPRQNSNPNEYAPTPPPTYNEATQQAPGSSGMLNQGAMNRLAQSGVAVPGFGIGRNASPPVPARHNPLPIPTRQMSSSVDPPAAPAATGGHNSQLGELQNRFANMSTRSPAAPAPTTGTSWADKQAALRTASSLREDPSTVSANDVRGAASTASNFQQRHGAQVASGLSAANGLNKKYGLAGRVNSLASSSTVAASPPQSPTQSSPGGFAGKLAPPPPKKKRELGGGSGEPPPIPLSSKPKF